MARPNRCLNNLILLVVLIAGLGILAALALGTYFALQPKTESRRSSARISPGQLYNPKFLYTPPPRNISSSLSELAVSDNGTVAPQNTPSTPFVLQTRTTTPKVFGAGIIIGGGGSTKSIPLQFQHVYTESDKTTRRTTKPPTTTAKTTPEPKKTTAELAHLVLPEDVENFVSPERQPSPISAVTPESPVITFPAQPAQFPVASGQPRSKQPTTQTEPKTRIPLSGQTEIREKSTSADSRKVTQPDDSIEKQQGKLVAQSQEAEDGALEKHLLGYQKIAGISYRNGYLYVPSYVNGKVSVLSTPDMSTLIEYGCEQCSIYDIAALSTGDMIAVLGRNHQMVKMDPTGREIDRIDLDYATKGLAINGYNEIFVLSRTHEEIYVYNKDLNPIAMVRIPGKAPGDCNFLAVNDSDVLFVSCQEAVYVFTVNGDPIMKILPPRGVSYGVGMDIDQNGNILVVRRGQGVLDVYDSHGNYLEAVGEGVDTLWSDIAVGEEHLYVVDYIDAKIKVFKYV